MTTEAQNLPFALPAPLFRVPYTLRGSTVIVTLLMSRVLYKSTLFMQNKPNLLNTQMNVNPVLRKDYKNETLSGYGKNKPNSNPIQSQSNPISKQNKPNQSQSNPISKPKIHPNCGICGCFPPIFIFSFYLPFSALSA